MREYPVDISSSETENVDRIKKEYANQIELELIIRDINQGVQKSYFNIDQVANYLKIEYTPTSPGRIIIITMKVLNIFKFKTKTEGKSYFDLSAKEKKK